MSGARGVAEVYQAQWIAELSSAMTSAFRQTLAEKPPDPVARIGRLLTARVDGPAPESVPPPSDSSSDPSTQPQPDDDYSSRWFAHINAKATQAWKQTIATRPSDPVVHLGRLLLAASTSGAVTVLEAEDGHLRAQPERGRAMRAVDHSPASGATSQKMAPAAPAAHPPPAGAAVRTLEGEMPPLQSTKPLLSAPKVDTPGHRRELSVSEEEGAEEDQGKWSLLAWARGAGVHRVVAAAIQRGAADKVGEESATDSEAVRGFLRGLTDKSELAPLFGTGPVADAMTDLVWLEVEKLKLELKLKLKGALTRAMVGDDARNEASTDVMGKFDGAIELSFFGLDKFFGGLGGIIGEPSPKVRDGMEAEHLDRSESTETFVTGCAAATASAHSSTHQHICTAPTWQQLWHRDHLQDRVALRGQHRQRRSCGARAAAARALARGV